MQASMKASHLFHFFKGQVRLYVMALKANGALNTLKPKPMQAAEIRSCAEATNCGAITIIYGRVTAYLKMLAGPRNPVFVALRWGHVHFIPTYYMDEASKETMVRITSAGRVHGTACACCCLSSNPALLPHGIPVCMRSSTSNVRVACGSCYMPRMKRCVQRGHCEQVTFMCEFAIAWDKSPNVFGIKNIVVDNTAALNEEDADWNCSLGSVGEHLLSIAIHQRVIDVADLAGLKVGEHFKLSHLIQKRNSRSTRPNNLAPADVDAMCDPRPGCCCCVVWDSYMSAHSTDHHMLTCCHLRCCSV